MATEISCLVSPKSQIFLWGASASTAEALKKRGYSVLSGTIPKPLSRDVRCFLPTCDIVLLDVTATSSEVLKTIEELDAVIGISTIRPRILCFSTTHRNSQFVLGIENRRARYVRVDGPEMLLEAIELLLAEMNHLERNGPCFHIVHRYSQGTCAPGEEIAAVLLAHDGASLQLLLPLAQRFVFDLLAQHRRVALDSLQIVSGLRGDWFYRDHAANSGHRQLKRIRRATVKVLVQRIRETMASVFRTAQIQLNPADVLRSCPAEGSKRVLYQLHADILWRHVSLR